MRKNSKKTIRLAIRMLDNVMISLLLGAASQKLQLKASSNWFRFNGFQDALYELKINYASKQAVDFADYSMELISYHAIQASCDLAKERGAYETFEGSLWSKGILPIDSINLLQQSRGHTLEQDRSQKQEWESLRTKVRTQGIRNSNIMAIGTIGNHFQYLWRFTIH